MDTPYNFFMQLSHVRRSLEENVWHNWENKTHNPVHFSNLLTAQLNSLHIQEVSRIRKLHHFAQHPVSTSQVNFIKGVVYPVI